MFHKLFLQSQRYIMYIHVYSCTVSVPVCPFSDILQGHIHVHVCNVLYINVYVHNVQYTRVHIPFLPLPQFMFLFQMIQKYLQGQVSMYMYMYIRVYIYVYLYVRIMYMYSTCSLVHVHVCTCRY